jgi:hypothetical protein
MKTKSIFFSVLFAATAFAVLTNCSGNKKEDSTTESHDAHASHDSTELSSESATSQEASAPQFQVDASFQQQLASVFSSYIELKEAFVSSDATKVKEEATGTNEALNKVDMKLLSGVAHNDWMNYLSPIQTSLKEIQASTDIEAQRKAFSTLSDNLYKSIKAFGLGGKEAFYDFCPMAFDNAGGYWLSDQKQIRNPYFGDKMLTCGSIQETLQ